MASQLKMRTRLVRATVSDFLEIPERNTRMKIPERARALVKRRRRDLATSRRPARKDRLRPGEESPLRRPDAVFNRDPFPSAGSPAAGRGLFPQGPGTGALMAEVKVKVQPPDADPVEIENR